VGWQSGKRSLTSDHRPFATDVDLHHDTHLKVLRFFQIYSRKSHQGFWPVVFFYICPGSDQNFIFVFPSLRWNIYNFLRLLYSTSKVFLLENTGLTSVNHRRTLYITAIAGVFVSLWNVDESPVNYILYIV
jgi:hypothetical protein